MTRKLVSLLLSLSASTVLAQTPSASPPSADEYTPRFEVGPFGSVTRFTVNQDAPNKAVFSNGGRLGARFTYNLQQYIGLEFAGAWGTNNARVPLTDAVLEQSVAFGSRTWSAQFGPVFYLLNRSHRIRPFLRAGGGGLWFVPTNDAKLQYNFQPYNLDPHMSFVPAVFYGAGLTGYVGKKMGVRVEIDGSYSKQPHYHLPSSEAFPGNAYIPYHGTFLGMNVTAGVFWGFGGAPQAILPTLPPPPPPDPVLDINWPATRNVDAGCPGEGQPIELSVTARTNLPGHRPSYRWTVDGAPQGDDSPTFRYTPNQPGQHVVAVTVSDDFGTSADTRVAQSVTRELLVANVREYRPPTISGSANPAEIMYGQSASLSLSPLAGSCNGALSYSCRAPEGTITGTPSSEFSSTGVAFDMSDRSRAQTKLVNIECTVNDEKGGTGSTTLPVRVSLPAELVSQRLDDIVFPSGNSRVNNCGKRILLEEVARQLADHPDWDLVLVGHIAPNERQGSLDRERVYNVVATLTAGTDTCARVDMSRIKVAFAGSVQRTEPRGAFCGTSTRPAALERRDQMVTADDPLATARRVEVHLVPRGASMPTASDNYEVVTSTTITPRGCPK